ncbi:MAG TPA: DUF6174 domain-containing protein [Anaerolineales bacterium]|nr:DUF6174 domain-containing protein [Anaerolineales bacterium]
MKINKLIFLTSILICVACAPETPSKEEINEALNNQLERIIASENQLWEDLNIDSYQIEVNSNSNWVDYTLTLTVKNNVVANFEASCGQAIIDFDGSFCKETLPTILPNNYTIPALFDELKKSRMDFESEWGEISPPSWSESIIISFDSQYHYPQLIKFDHPNVADEEYKIEILNFEILQD